MDLSSHNIEPMAVAVAALAAVNKTQLNHKPSDNNSSSSNCSTLTTYKSSSDEEILDDSKLSITSTIDNANTTATDGDHKMIDANSTAICMGSTNCTNNVNDKNCVSTNNDCNILLPETLNLCAENSFNSSLISSSDDFNATPTSNNTNLLITTSNQVANELK